ncbi:MAG: glycosyltransferase family A protein [Planctomycetota bacterium]
MVSILIPCYNAERWVGEAIRSAMGQTYGNKEVIVLDDGSTDGSLEVVRSFGDLIRWGTGPNRGSNPARNRLLEMSAGEWIQFLDADDYLLPTKIEEQMRVVERVEPDLVVSPCLREGRVVDMGARTRDPWADLLSRGLGNTCSNLWRRSAVEAAGRWEPEQRVGQEYELMFRMLKMGAKVMYCGAALTVVRRVNPESVWWSREAQGIRARGKNIRDAARFLVQQCAMTRERRRVASLESFRVAQWMWSRSDRGWREFEAFARAVDPAFKETLREVWPLYGAAYAAGGMHAAQRYGELARAVKRFLGISVGGGGES